MRGTILSNKDRLDAFIDLCDSARRLLQREIHGDMIRMHDVVDEKASYFDTQLVDKQGYVVRDGALAGSVFLYQFGHRRPFLSMDDFRAVFGPGCEPRPILAHQAQEIPRGPYVPQANRPPLETLLGASNYNIDSIREALCDCLKGDGYEIGAGERPTCVPLNCSVTYVDAFTFEEAKDGSFVGKQPQNFAKVSFYEPMHRLESIEDSSASFFIACHVIEHVPNVIASLREVTRKLRSGGRLILVVPDKRYIFDSGRPTTTLEHFVAEDLRPDLVPSLEHYLEYARRAMGAVDWIGEGSERYQRIADLHHHCFTPESMRELLDHVSAQLGFEEAKVIVHAYAEQVGEFYVRIKKA
jgi:ubiquinone/menaquinone biosynthesis C-methylase UbiE